MLMLGYFCIDVMMQNQAGSVDEDVIRRAVQQAITNCGAEQGDQ